MTKLTTHILDLTHGKPASNVAIELFFIQSEAERIKIADSVTNRDGRLAQPLLSSESFEPGEYELLFYIGDYFYSKNIELSSPPFLNKVSVRIGLSQEQKHYHVPLLVSPWGYQVYRGS
ncbi:hydroxyisourate hydrolase [Priestia megaterium]|nr:hydroxyisourate hydrolase [Priestia megaterium]